MKILSSKTVFTSFNFVIKQNTIERNNKTFAKDFILRNPVVLVIAYEGDTIYLQSEFRDSINDWSLEVVSGGMDKNATPLENAKRELQEETGFTATTWHHLADWELSVSMNAPIHVFAATGLTKGEAHLELDEEIELKPMSMAEVIKKLETGELKAASHIAALLLFERKRKEGKL